MPNCKHPMEDRRVFTIKGNYSHFEKPKGQFHPSDWSSVTCLRCNHSWRTKSDYVYNIPKYEGG